MPLRRYIERLFQSFNNTYEIQIQPVTRDEMLLRVGTLSGQAILTRRLKSNHIANRDLLDLIMADCEREIRQYETAQDAAAVKAELLSTLKDLRERE